MSVTISSSELPVIDRAGQFPLMNPVPEFTYRNSTHALHLYDYSARVRVGSEEYAVRPGDITCIQSGRVYSIVTKEPGKHWCVHYYDRPIENDGSIEIPGHLCLGANSQFYREQIQHISRLSNSPDLSANADLVKLEARFRLKSLLLALHNLGAIGLTGRRSRSNFSWDHLLGWVDENLQQPISVSLLAQRANLEPSSFSKKFRETHKTTLSRYLLHRRIDKAKSLLATTTLTIYEVGATVGISDPQYFNKQFRKITGISPSRYRDENQEYLSNIPDDVAVQDGIWQMGSSEV